VDHQANQEVDTAVCMYYTAWGTLGVHLFVL
ncbi:MAG: hypothetical protein AVDCRST_MAG93-8396, partial [uncultured Chloroflexia bacterium]